MSKRYNIKIEPEAIADIQEAIIWYNEQQKDLGSKFYLEVEDSFAKLALNPFYQLRYDNVRCIPLQKFPFLIHFTISEEKNLLVIRGVINTYLDPKKWTPQK